MDISLTKARSKQVCNASQRFNEYGNVQDISAFTIVIARGVASYLMIRIVAVLDKEGNSKDCRTALYSVLNIHCAIIVSTVIEDDFVKP